MTGNSKSMFESLQAPAVDKIIAIMQAFKADPRTDKIDLGIGVYRDADGRTPVFKAIQESQQRLVASELTKEYVGVAGDPEFCALISALLFGESYDPARVTAVQAVGGTGALRVIADSLAQAPGTPRIWVPDPTWANHYAIFRAAGFEVLPYPYYDRESGALAFGALMDFLGEREAGDIVLFHACCQNPTGQDPSKEEWKQILDVVVSRGVFPLIDTAYHGFGQGLEPDSFVPRKLLDAGVEFAAAYSCSKNFGMYRDRVGAAIFAGAPKAGLDNAKSVAMSVARGTYSMPPNHGAAVVRGVLADADLTRMWREELSDIRERILRIRARLDDALLQSEKSNSLGNLSSQNGMFSLLNLSEGEVERLKVQSGVYVMPGGRINVAGLNETTVDRVAQAVCEALER